MKKGYSNHQLQTRTQSSIQLVKTAESELNLGHGTVGDNVLTQLQSVFLQNKDIQQPAR